MGLAKLNNSVHMESCTDSPGLSRGFVDNFINSWKESELKNVKWLLKNNLIL